MQHPDSCTPTHQLWHTCDTDACLLLAKRLGTLCGPGKPGSFRNICTTALGKEPPVQGVLILPWVLSVSSRVPVSYPYNLVLSHHRLSIQYNKFPCLHCSVVSVSHWTHNNRPSITQSPTSHFLPRSTYPFEWLTET